MMFRHRQYLYSFVMILLCVQCLVHSHYCSVHSLITDKELMISPSGSFSFRTYQICVHPHSEMMLPRIPEPGDASFSSRMYEVGVVEAGFTPVLPPQREQLFTAC